MTQLRPEPLKTVPTVSVVIPCYNYGHFLPEAVASALDQPGVSVDVLIVDDASPDGSVNVARTLAAADKRVSVVEHKSNIGHIATYNDGLARAQGKYVVLLSADDLLTPGSLTRSTALMEAHPDVSMTYGYARTFNDTPPLPKLNVRGWSIWSGPGWIEHLFRRGHNVVVNPEAIMRTDVMRTLGGYEAGLPHAADMYLWMQAALHGRIGRVNGPDQALYREHGANMHLTDYAGLLIDMTQRRSVFERLLTMPEAKTLDRPRLDTIFRKSLAQDSFRLGRHACDVGQHIGVTGQQFADFAVATAPQASSMRGWGSLQSRLAKPAPKWRVRLAGQVGRIRGIVRWRRWRRYGR